MSSQPLTVLEKFEDVVDLSLEEKEHHEESCQNIAGWCTGSTSTLKRVDCTGSGKAMDWACIDSAGNRGTIIKKNGCARVWPNAPEESCPAAFLPATPASCEKPDNWCTHEGSKLSRVDCNGTGVLDWVCIDDAGNRGTITKANGCKQTWPNAQLSSCIKGFMEYTPLSFAHFLPSAPRKNRQIKVQDNATISRDSGDYPMLYAHYSPKKFFYFIYDPKRALFRVKFSDESNSTNAKTTFWICTNPNATSDMDGAWKIIGSDDELDQVFPLNKLNNVREIAYIDYS
jgi:hypothetical protein